MKKWKFSTSKHIYRFYYFQKNSTSIYFIKKLRNTHVVENCTIILKNSTTFNVCISAFIRKLKYKDMSLTYFNKLKYNDDEFCNVSKNSFIYCPECTNMDRKNIFRCQQCNYYKLLRIECKNEIDVDSMYITPYISTNTLGLLIYSLDKDQFPENNYIIKLSNISIINCIIKNLEFIKSKMKEN